MIPLQVIIIKQHSPQVSESIKIKKQHLRESIDLEIRKQNRVSYVNVLKLAEMVTGRIGIKDLVQLKLGELETLKEKLLN